MSAVQVVWFGRDLRWEDHPPLAAACATGDDVVCIYVIEPASLAEGSYDEAHHRFVHAAVRELDAALRARGNQLTVLVGDVPDVLDQLARRVDLRAIHTCSRVGSLASRSRDKRVGWWCQDHGVALHRYRDDGVLDQSQGEDWPARWEATMTEPPLPAPTRVPGGGLVGQRWPSAASLGLVETERGRDFVGGVATAVQTLSSWLEERVARYAEHGDQPALAWECNSRLSPWLAWGCLSMRQVVAATDAALSRCPDEACRHALRTFRERLQLRAEALQQLHDEPALQFRSMNRGLDDLRPEVDTALLEAWEAGRTGYPLVDASMRYLRRTGWLPYGLRRLVVQFACFHLWQPWREVARRLGALFLDFEAGIHYPQIQVLTGGTAQTLPSIPNPSKLAQQVDPEGTFLRAWLPELAQVEDTHLYTPWRMSGSAQRRSGCRIGRDYPHPLVHHATAYKQAKRRLEAANQRDHVREDESRVAVLHEHRPAHLATARASSARG